MFVPISNREVRAAIIATVDHAVVAKTPFDHEQVVESRVLGPLGEIHGLAVTKTESPQGDAKLDAHHQSTKVKACV